MNVKLNSHSSRTAVRRTVLALAIASGMGLSAQVLAQATTGSIFGTAPVAAGETVKVVSNQTGLTREVAVDSSGRYSANNLPVGSYSVSLMQGGKTVASQNNVMVSVSGGTQVPFAAGGKNVENLASVTVTANSVPAIDVSSTRQTSVITSQQLKVLPLAHSAEAIALLAPGVASGNTSLGTGPAGTPLVSFGGDSVVENAYYINGFNTTDPVGGAGGIALPYFAISEQQTITSGYGAEYGRSTGGVISQIGHRGGNEFHAGVYATWSPTWLQSGYDNVYYANPLSTTAGQQYGNVYQNQSNNSAWTTVYDAYVSGPLIKDKLFFYLTAEAQHDNSKTTSANTASGISQFNAYSYKSPKFYGKLDWNINDSNVLEGTYIQSKVNDESNNAYTYNYNTNKIGNFTSINNPLYASKFNIGILKYTSYITDDITLSVLAGKMKSTYFSQQAAYAGFDPTMAGMGLASGALTQNPLAPGFGNFNNNPSTLPTSNHKSSTNNFRIDLDWKLGDHDLRFGMDNQRSTDLNDGTVSAGPGYYWTYGQQSNLTSPTLLCNNLNQCVASAVSPSNPQGYFAEKVIYGGSASFTVMQKAQYIADNWQVTPNLLLNLGVRNDQYTNYNAQMVPYVRETKPQWQPRLGFSWDIFGDSTSKLYGNVGRYYLALPSGLGVRMAGANAYTDTYFAYTSISPTGLPLGPDGTMNSLKQIPATAEPFSADGEYGVPKDPKVVAAADLKPMYQDEYVLGFQQAFQLFGQSLVWGSQATYSKMNNIVDDTGTITLPTDAAPSEAGTELDVLVNPGRVNTLRYLATDGTYKTYKWDPRTATGSYGAVVGFPRAFRKYYSLEESLEHPWDGKWMGKIDYVFSKSYGTTEGPTNSAVGQITSASGAAGGLQSGSITTAWDFPEIMQYANGELPNSHRHTFKAYGAYQVAPEWLLSGMLILQSGAPISCLGYYGPTEQDPYGYTQPFAPGAYHWCGGKPMRPGDAGNTPWTHQLNLGVTYTPEWAGKHLSMQLQVHNVLNEQKGTRLIDFYGSSAAPYSQYLLPRGIESPRYATLSVKYDW